MAQRRIYPGLPPRPVLTPEPMGGIPQFQMSLGQLTVIHRVTPVRKISSALKRAIREVIRRRTEATDFQTMTTRGQNLIIKSLIARLTKGSIDSIEDLLPNTHIEDAADRVVDGQEGYTQQWEDTTWQCGLGQSGQHFWAALPTDVGNTCLNWGADVATMEETTDLLWKFKWEHENQIFHVGTSMKGFLRTGTPGEGLRLRPLPRQSHGRNRRPVITALNPFAQLPGQWTQTRSIPEALMPAADALADLQEHDVEGRSRSSGERSALSSGIRGQTFEFSRGPPRKTRDGVKTKAKNPSKPTGNEGKKVIGIAKGSLLAKLLNGITEGLDIWNVAYDALPSSIKPRGRTSQLQRIELVVKNIHRLNLEAFIEGLIINEIEDIVFGTIGGAAAKFSSRVTARPTGELSGLASSRGSAVRAGR